MKITEILQAIAMIIIAPVILFATGAFIFSFWILMAKYIIWFADLVK